MKYLVTIKKVQEYEVEADSRTEAYQKASRGDITPLAAQEKAISLQLLGERK